jgi:hypothetical protein
MVAMSSVACMTGEPLSALFYCHAEKVIPVGPISRMSKKVIE